MPKYIEIIQEAYELWSKRLNHDIIWAHFSPYITTDSVVAAQSDSNIAEFIHKIVHL